MKQSSERIQFIASYLSAYEERIKLLNNNGLFDEAKLFELFAVNVGSLYLGIELSNLNIDTYTYPCVDLISEDKKVYVQVSTAKDIPSKIKKTLENISKSNKKEIKSITNVIFFVLNNESVARVKDYFGENQIGDVPFNKNKNLVTTQDIFQKATDDLQFQNSLYKLLISDEASVKSNSYKLNEAIKISKTVGLGNIDDRINSEYEIDRDDLIKKIIKDNHKNISIQGEAGSGKSVLCKKIVEDDQNLIYARAERFSEETDINDVWGFDVRQTLEFLSDNPITFFIDSLEFIADRPTKLDLLSTLYEITKDYPMSKVITSCRSSDKNSFIKTEENYSIKSYEVPNLTIEEQKRISEQYAIISKMLKMNSYTDLLRSPFYINLIVSKLTDIDNISDENELREHIWHNIICLNDSQVTEVIKSIVFSRARNFSLGANIAEYEKDTIEKLISEDVLVKNGETVRLKYDIFEDICFEQLFDHEFVSCKGVYSHFFKKIEDFGRCSYRRYQIWVSNKLLNEKNRERFIYELVFSEMMPEHWKKQTRIGLVKSRYCNEFFIDYGHKLIECGLIVEFTKTANLYAFEIRNDSLTKTLPYIRLQPIGEGRTCIIELIAEKKLYKKNIIPISDLEKICIDYSKVSFPKDSTLKEVILILDHIINKKITEISKSPHNLEEVVKRLLIPMYEMAENSKEWILEFWNKLDYYYKNEEITMSRFAESIIEFTLRSEHINLGRFLPKELCDLSEMFWTYDSDMNKDKVSFSLYSMERDDISNLYGLSIKADDYERRYLWSTASENNFFRNLFMTNFWHGLEWAVNFINKAVVHFSENNPNKVNTYKVYFFRDDEIKNYLGSTDMWLATTEEHRMPMIISDLIYCMSTEICKMISSKAVAVNTKIKFANYVKKIIYEKSNNIALLTVILDIGLSFKDNLPGFSLDLATNIEIIELDLMRNARMHINPPFSNRYSRVGFVPESLDEYVLGCELTPDKKTREKSLKIIDYLYKIVPNDYRNARKYFHIQKMDIRSAKIVEIDDNTYELIPTITGEADKIVKEQELSSLPMTKITEKIRCWDDKISQDSFRLSECIEAIEVLMEYSQNSEFPLGQDSEIVKLIVWALRDNNLGQQDRSNLCEIWMEGIRKCFSQEIFMFEKSLCLILFKQLEYGINLETSNKLKELMLDLLLFDNQNGTIHGFSDYVKLYLQNNQKLAKSFFVTIVKLSEDEMKHQKFNVEYIKKYYPEEKIDFKPNKQSKLLGVDRIIDDDKRTHYNSQRKKIIEDYLFNSMVAEMSIVNLDNYDIEFICYAINCGLSLEDNMLYLFSKELIPEMIDIWEITKKTHDAHEILDVYSQWEVKEFFQRELFIGEYQANIIFEVLFDNIDFSNFTQDTLNFYQDIFSILIVKYFDSHSSRELRMYCEKIIQIMEIHINSVEIESIKISMYKSLILAPGRYGRSGDWSKLPSDYLYQDVQFLNQLFSKYGRFHLEDMLFVIYKLSIEKLLPWILLSINNVFTSLSSPDESTSTKFEEILVRKKQILLVIISKSFINFNDVIKQDHDLTNAFENVLEILIINNFEEAATILDEFRIH